MTSSDLYLEFFGFAERPFTLVPDPEVLYWSKQHKRAYSVLEFGLLSSAPVTLVTGEVGAGKTTLLQALLRTIDDQVTVGLVSNAQGDRGELLQWVLHALGLRFDAQTSYVQLFQQLQQFMLEEYAAGRRVMLVFDEAQNLSMESLEELRMLTNINANKDVLVQLILVGQPELREMIQQPSMLQLAQRIAASFHLPAMDAETVAAYVTHRLKAVGGTGEEFSPDVLPVIHQTTGGVPRLVNQLCEFALLYAWSADQKLIDLQVIKDVITDGVFFGAAPKEQSPLVLFNRVSS